MQMEGIIASGQVVPLRFMQDALAASQTDVQLNVAEVNAAATLTIDGITIPFAGSIVGISVDTNVAATAGNLAAGATINGTEQATTTQTITTATSAYDTFQREAVRFAKGDKLGVEITTSAGWDGTTADLVVTLWVLIDLKTGKV